MEPREEGSGLRLPEGGACPPPWPGPDLTLAAGVTHLRLHFSWYSCSWFSLTLNSLTRASRLALRRFWWVSYRNSWLFSSSCRLRSWRQEEYSSSSLSWRTEGTTAMGGRLVKADVGRAGRETAGSKGQTRRSAGIFPEEPGPILFKAKNDAFKRSLRDGYSGGQSSAVTTDADQAPPRHTQIYTMGFCRHLLLQVDADLTLAWNVFPRLTT